MDQKLHQKSNLNSALDLIFSELGLESTVGDIPINENSIGMTADIAEVYGRLVTVALACWGNKEMAYRAVDRAFEQWEELKSPAELTYVDQVFNSRIANFLHKNGIETIADICQQNRTSLAMLGFEFKTVLRIESDLQAIGFCLRSSEI